MRTVTASPLSRVKNLNLPLQASRRGGEGRILRVRVCVCVWRDNRCANGMGKEMSRKDGRATWHCGTRLLVVGQRGQSHWTLDAMQVCLGGEAQQWHSTTPNADVAHGAPSLCVVTFSSGLPNQSQQPVVFVWLEQQAVEWLFPPKNNADARCTSSISQAGKHTKKSMQFLCSMFFSHHTSYLPNKGKCCITPTLKSCTVTSHMPSQPPYSPPLRWCNELLLLPSIISPHPRSLADAVNNTAQL
jgi:hypothetical protein